MKINLDKLTHKAAPQQGAPTFIPQMFSNLTQGIANLFGFKWGEANYGSFMKDGFKGNPYAYIVIDKIATLGARLPRTFLNPDTQDEAPSVPAYLDLIKKPNEKLKKESFYWSIFVKYLTYGGVFIHRLRAIGSNDVELIVPSPEYVTINHDAFGNVTSYDYTYFGRSMRVEPENMLYIHRPDPQLDSYYGFSAMQPGSKIYQADNELRLAKASLFKNRGASGLIYSKGNMAMTPKEREELQKYWDAQTGGENRDKRYVSGTELGHIPLGLDGNMMRAIQTESISNLKDMAMLFGLDPILFDTDSSSYNNRITAQESLYTDTVIPLANKIDYELSEFIISEVYKKKNVVYAADVSQIDALNSVNKEEAETVKLDIEAGLITPNEGRALRYPKLPELEIEQPINAPTDGTKAEGEGEDINATAQANLRGSVGGVQGILEIQAAVAGGITLYSAGLSILTIVYGFDEPTARAMLGDEAAIEAANNERLQNEQNNGSNGQNN